MTLNIPAEVPPLLPSALPSQAAPAQQNGSLSHLQITSLVNQTIGGHASAAKEPLKHSVMAPKSDPLQLSYSQLFLLSSALVYWTSTLAQRNEWLTKEQAMIAEWGAHIVTVLADSTRIHSFFKEAHLTNPSHLKFLFNNPCFKACFKCFERSWDKAAAWAVSFGCSVTPFVPLLTLSYQSWNAYHVAQEAFKGLKTCWQNIQQRGWKATSTASVHLINSCHSTFKVYDALLKCLY